MKTKTDLPMAIEAGNSGLPALPLRQSEVFKVAPAGPPMRAQLTLAQDIELYLKSLAISFSANTTLNYGRDLRGFDRIVSEKYGRPIPSAAVNVEAVQFYLFNLRRRDVAGATYERHYHALKAFFEFRLAFRGLPKVMEGIRAPKHKAGRLPAVLSVEDAARLCDSTSKSNRFSAMHDRRDRALIETLYSTGIRVSEAVHLRWSDIDEAGGYVTVRKGKGDKDRTTPIGEPALAKLRAWRKKLKPSPQDPVFSSARGPRSDPLTTRGVQQMIAKRAAAAGIKLKITPHTLRHSFVTHLLERGADIQSIGEMAGHSNLTTTAGYAHVNMTLMQEAAKRHPLWEENR